MGAFAADGSALQVYAINKCTQNGTDHWYEIELAGRPYYYFDYVTVVTRAGDDRRAAYNSVGGRLLVSIYDGTGNLIQGSFSVVVLDPTP